MLVLPQGMHPTQPRACGACTRTQPHEVPQRAPSCPSAPAQHMAATRKKQASAVRPLHASACRSSLPVLVSAKGGTL